MEKGIGLLISVVFTACPLSYACGRKRIWNLCLGLVDHEGIPVPFSFLYHSDFFSFPSYQDDDGLDDSICLPRSLLASSKVVRIHQVHSGHFLPVAIAIRATPGPLKYERSKSATLFKRKFKSPPSILTYYVIIQLEVINQIQLTPTKCQPWDRQHLHQACDSPSDQKQACLDSHPKHHHRVANTRQFHSLARAIPTCHIPSWPPASPSHQSIEHLQLGSLSTGDEFTLIDIYTQNCINLFDDVVIVSSTSFNGGRHFDISLCDISYKAS